MRHAHHIKQALLLVAGLAFAACGGGAPTDTTAADTSSLAGITNLAEGETCHFNVQCAAPLTCRPVNPDVYIDDGNVCLPKAEENGLGCDDDDDCAVPQFLFNADGTPYHLTCGVAIGYSICS